MGQRLVLGRHLFQVIDHNHRSHSLLLIELEPELPFDGFKNYQFAVGLSTLSMTTISTRPFCGARRSPSCSLTAVKIVGPFVSGCADGVSGGNPIDSGPPSPGSGVHSSL